MELHSNKVFGNDIENLDLCIMVPTYKRMRLLKTTLLSALRQEKTKLKYQVIVVSNDPSFDANEIGITLDPNLIKIYRNDQNYGMVSNMNRCIDLSEGQYVCFVQDDDVLLPNFLQVIEKEIEKGSFEEFDCLIPKRFFYFGNGFDFFSHKARSQHIPKELFAKLLPHARKRIRKIDYLVCASVWNNCFGGGPTCGIVFKNEALKSMRFDVNYPFVFDYVFFIEFSERFRVGLLNKYLAIYRMEGNSSNKPEVQYDFYRGELLLLKKTETSCKFVIKNKKEIENFMVLEKPAETQKMIGGTPCRVSSFSYKLFKLKRFFRMCSKGLYNKRNTPRKFISLVEQ